MSYTDERKQVNNMRSEHGNCNHPDEVGYDRTRGDEIARRSEDGLAEKAERKMEKAEKKIEKAEKKLEKAGEKFAKGYVNDGERKLEKAEKKLHKAQEKMEDGPDGINRNIDRAKERIERETDQLESRVSYDRRHETKE